MNNLIFIITALLLSAFFSGMEIAFINANKLRIELDRKQGTLSSGIIAIFNNNASKYFFTMLVGNSIALVIYSLVMASILKPHIEIFINQEFWVLLILIVLSALLILVTAEFIPKIIFRSFPTRFLHVFALSALFFYILFYPLTSLINWVSEKLIIRFHRSENTENEVKKVFNRIDLLHLINHSPEEKIVSSEIENDLKIFRNALDFSSVKVRDCMIPRTEIVAVELNTSTDDLRQRFIETGFSKILIYEETIDNIIGYVTSKTLFKNLKSFRENIIEISFVPETMAANGLLEKFIQEKKSMAVVVDEFGGVSGMLTIEDIIEEIFGEIEDEHDTIELIEKQINDEEFIFSGRLEIDYLNDKYNLKLPDSEDYETLAGWIIHHYENIPNLNERILIEPYEVKILKASRTKIELAHLKTTQS